MDIEKYQQYAKSRVEVSEMRKKIRDHLDKFKTAQRVGYEAAKIQYKPLLEAQEVQTKAQEAQTQKQIQEMKKLQKSPGLSKETQAFIIKNGFLMPSSLLEDGIEAFKVGRQEAWKESMLDLSLHLRTLTEGGVDPQIKKAAEEYRKSLKEVVSTLLKQQPRKDTFLTPATSMETLTDTQPEKTGWLSSFLSSTASTDTQPKKTKWSDNFNHAFTNDEIQALDNLKITLPQKVYKEGLKAKEHSINEYQKWKNEQELRIEHLKSENKKNNARKEIDQEVKKEENRIRKKYYDTLLAIINKTERVSQIGSGIRRNQKKYTIGGNIFMNPQDLFNKLELITGSIIAGNTSQKIRNNAYKILDKLLSIKLITKSIYNKYIKEYLLH